MKLTRGSSFVSRFSGAFTVVVLSLFLVAIVLAMRVAKTPSSWDVAILLVELALGAAGLVLAYGFPKNPVKLKKSIVALLAVVLVFNGWLMFAYLDSSSCPWGSTTCDLSYAGYLVIVGALAGILLVAKSEASG